jgi:subtilase family serine protease
MFGYFSSRSSRKPATRKRTKTSLQVEFLEGRDVPSTTAVAQPDYVLIDKAGTATPLDTASPTGLTPTQIRAAYGFNQLSLDGTGTTIAIVDAYDDPDIASDLHQFDVQFGLPDPSFTKVSQTGSTTALPAGNTGWSDEISLDVEWAHVIAPGAKILLVEANSDSFNDLTAAVQYAAKQPGVVAVSMSWGGGEFNGETSYDSDFTTPAGHTGVTFVASSGDTGAPISYPAASPNVLSVGGTTLNVTSTGTYVSESAWSGSGGGTSTFEAEPSYQKSVVTATGRDNPDVSYDADPSTGFPVYDSYDNGTKTPWAQFGGTSDAAPQWAALVALADEGRINNGLTALNGPTQTLPMIYSLSASDFHDVTSGASTGSPKISATAGYDRVTGRGTPIANKVVADLVGGTIAPPAPSAAGFTLSAPLTSVAGTSISVTVTALGSNGATFPSFLGTVALSSSDVLAGLPASYTFTAADKGTHTFTVNLKTAGADSITATNGSVTGSDSVTVSPAAASVLAFGQQPGSTTIGSTLSVVTVRILDAFGNLETSDNSDSVSLSLSSGTLGGTATEKASAGVATFANLTVAATGTYTLTAAETGRTSAKSSSFTISSVPVTPPPVTGGTVIENFESTETWNFTGGPNITASRTTAAAHDGTYGLDDSNGNDWIYRTGAADQVSAGETLSVWLKFAGNADGRAYFGFGASNSGTLSVVAAPNSNQLIIQSDPGFNNFIDLASVPATYQANAWYRVEVDWSTTGAITAKVYASNGTTLLYSVSAKTTSITSGGIAFRATGSDKYWDTVTVTQAGNSFAMPTSTTTTAPSGSSTSTSSGTTTTPPCTKTSSSSTSTTTPSAAWKATAAAGYSPPAPMFVQWDAWSLYLPY